MAATATKRKRAAHLGPERRRPEVLDAALDLFLDHGYEGTSMQAIAERAGVTKPVVYACFPGKDELFRALLAREEERILSEIQSAFEDADLTDPESTLIEGYTGFLRAVASSPDVYRFIFMGEGGGNMAVAHRIQRARAAQVDLLARGARRQGPEGRDREDRASARPRDRWARRVGRPPAPLGAEELDPGDARPRARPARRQRPGDGLARRIDRL
jgi:AcrR family transcriptional regulator